MPLKQEDVTRWKQRRANSLTLEIPKGASVDLSLVAEMQGLAHLQIGGDSRTLVDLGKVLSRLTRLQSLAINLAKYALSDVPPTLRDLRLTPYRLGVDMGGLKLNSLWVDGLRGFSDLKWLNGASVNRLVIQHAPDLHSLAGIPDDTSILRVDFAPRLNNLDALHGSSLKSLELYRCGNLKLPNGISTHLATLLMNECGSVASLTSLAGASELRRLEFYGSTRVEDGHVAFLAELPELVDVRFQNRSGYDSTREEIWAALSK